MKRMIKIICLVAVAGIIAMLPSAASAQTVGIGDGVYGLNAVLDNLFNEMLPLSARLIDVGRAVAGFAALWYISVRVWKHIANAEAIDFFPLLRPFAIGLAITLYSPLIMLMNGVLRPLEAGTREMARDNHMAIMYHIQQREKEIRETPPGSGYPGDNTDIEKYEQPSADGGGFLSGLRSAFSHFNIKNAAKQFISEALHILYAAASLAINVIRTFYLLVLAIVGPIAFGLSVFDGFRETLASWFARYIHVFLWLPVANLLGAVNSKILAEMLTKDPDFLSTPAYMIFMVISIVGYFTVPNLAGYIVQGGGDDTMLHKPAG